MLQTAQLCKGSSITIRVPLPISLSGNPVEPLIGDLLEVEQVDVPPAWPAGLETAAGEDVVALLADQVGARPWDRSPIETRIPSETLAGTTRHIDSQDEVGGYPPVEPATVAPFDPSQWDGCFVFVPEPGPRACGAAAILALAGVAPRRRPIAS